LHIVLLSIFFVALTFTKNDLSPIKNDPSVILPTKEIVEKDAAKKKELEKPVVSGKIQFISSSGDVVVDMGGKFVVEDFFGKNMTTLNAKNEVDTVFFVRSTADYFLSIAYGDYNNPRIMFYDAIRFRYRWGAPTDAKNVDSIVQIASVKQGVRGTATNRHLLWMREGWLKLRIGDEGNELNHYFQAGLIPYQVGRGISLGAAYEALGFLGFVPGSSIDQFAPSILLSINPIKNRLVIDAYLALTENNQLSVDNNIEIIRSNEIGVGCTQRGVGRQSFLSSLRADVLIYEQDKKKVNIEPYFVWQHAPDQDLEFNNDVNTYIGTAGLAIEGIYKRFNWGIEGAANFGEIDIRPWDRNIIVLSDRNINPLLSNIYEEYTKIYLNGNNLKDKNVIQAPASGQIRKIVDSSPKDASENGKQIGEVFVFDQDQVAFVTVPIFNATNRFRPEQRKTLQGYFLVADASYDIIPSDLVMSFGVGYASGEVDQQKDTNKLTSEQLLNQKFTGFIPLQSVYSGKRLRHLVLFNQGIARFAVRNPLADLGLSNVTGAIISDTVNEMTNIAFAGARIDWKIPQLKKYKFNFSQNVIPYFIPNPSSFLVSRPEDALILLTESSNYLGTEVTAEWSALFYDKLKFSGYFGVLIPGQHYKDMCGIPIGKGKLASGSDVAYVGNVQLSFLF
jgi:hypothetical protein